MADQVFNVTIKGIGDFSDVVSNVNSVQKALTKLKIPDKLGNNLSQNISNFMREYDKYQQKIAGGIKTQGDNNAVNRNLSSMLSSYQKIVNDFNKIKPKDFKELFKLDEGAFASITNKIDTIKESLKDIRIDPSQIEEPLKQIRGLTRSDKIVGDNGLLKAFEKGLTTGGVDGIVQARNALTQLENHLERFRSQMSKGTAGAWDEGLGKMRTKLEEAERAAGPTVAKLGEANRELDTLGAKGMGAFDGIQKGLNNTRLGAEKVTTALKNMHDQEFSFNRQVQMIDRQVQSYFGLSQMIRKVGNIAKSAFNTVKELDKAMTATAVVTNFDVGDMWSMLPTYTEQANQLGATIKDVYEAATLYYQQGLNTNQAMGLANETLKMARIAGMDAAQATDMMTAALRGFNMEINQASAQKVNDIYSQLAAITASDTKELGTAMEKTASLANSANMKIETTSAFLAQMIETTREAPENLGTAMKTIIARFQEMKKDPTKLVDSEGVAMDVNKVDTALKSIGVQLTNTQGEFRNLDDVFLEISKKWDSLTQGQQRYIATTAAGSRQQSRFIAMMSNYERTMELVNEANNSAGASQKQFEKTMESMDSKLNQLKNAWNQFTMGLMNNQVLKAGVTGITKFLDIINKIIDVLSKIPSKPFEGLTKSALTLGATLVGLNSAKKWLRGSIMAGAGWWRNEGTIRGNFMEGYGKPQRLTPLDLYNQKAEQRGLPKQESTVEARTNVVATVGNVDTSGVDAPVDTRVKNEIEGGPSVVAEKDIIVEPNPAMRGAGFGARGLRNPGTATNPITSIPTGTSAELDNVGESVKNTSNNFSGLGSSIAGAGYALQRFGDKLGPFGGIISTIGSLLMGFGTTLGTIATKAALAGGGFKGFAAAAGSVLGPMALIIGAAVAIGATIWALDKAFESDKEKIERLTSAAKTASDAYSNLKQEASELKDSLEQIKTNETEFDGLIAGTSEFNEKLTEANQKIDELLLKYPELNNPKYLSTDENGLKHINQEGFDYVEKYQEQLVANASALNMLQNAELKAEQERQNAESKETEIKNIKYEVEDPTYGSGYAKERDLTEQEKKRVELLEQEAKYSKEIADNTEKTAIQQSLATSFTDMAVEDRDRYAAIYANSYEAIKNSIPKNVSEEKMLETYAKYNGYSYEAASKKVFDKKGEEIEDIDKDVLKTLYPKMTAILEYNKNKDFLLKNEDAINQKFLSGLDIKAPKGKNILTDVLGGNIETNTDLVAELATKNLSQVEDALSELSDMELSALTGIKEEDIEGKKEEIVSEFSENIQNYAKETLESQNQVYEDLGAKLAKTKAVSPSKDIDTRGIPDNIARDIIGKELRKKEKFDSDIQEIVDRIKGLPVEQASFLNNMAGKIEENVGLDAMKTFLDNGIDIYKKNNKKIVKDFNNIIKGIKWDSASSRLAGYTKAIKSSTHEIRKWGKEQKRTASEANLLGDAFDEFVSGDWSQELVENADDFKNSLGEIDGSGILKAAEQSGELKNLLDSGEVSANAVATALQGIEAGKYSIGEVDTVVLQLLTSLTRLEDASLRAHNFITNFDPGIDTGEGEDFVKENAKKAQEYYDNHEWGNEQLESYIKAAAGEDTWNKTYRKYKGNMRKITKELMKYVTTFEDGFGQAWEQIINDKTITGDKLEDRIKEYAGADKELQERLNAFDIYYDKNDVMRIKLGDLSTDEVKTYFKEIYGVSEEYADLLLQDLKNYDATLEANLQKNDLEKTVESKDFQKGRKTTDKNGNEVVTLTDAEIKTFEAGNGDVEGLARNLGYEDIKDKKTGKVTTAGQQLKEGQFRVFKRNSDKRRTHYKDLLNDYANAFYQTDIAGLGEIKSLQTEGKLDLNKLMADARSKSFDDNQAIRSAYKAYRVRDKKGETTLYDGMEIESGITNFEDFEAAITKMTETEQWVQIGDTIGEQIVKAFENSSLRELFEKPDEGKTVKALENGETIKDAAFTPNDSGKNEFNEGNFNEVVDNIVKYSENKDKQQENIATYLSQSAEAFKDINDPSKQAEALAPIVEKLSSLDFNPTEIGKMISEGLGIGLSDGDGQHKGSLSTDENGKVTLDVDLAAESIEKQLSGMTAEVVEVKPQKTFDVPINGQVVSIGLDGSIVGKATGQNNPNSAFHRVGTMARGSRGGYTISGRPTLTGEEGEELVWEPKRNEAYMVGSKGPQFANISKDAVVWNADQTKRIKKNSSSVGRVGTGARGITPFGTMASGTKISGTGILDVMANIIGFNGLNEDKKEQGLTIDVTAVVNTLNVKEEAKTITGLKGEITAEKVNKSGQIQGEPVKLSGVVENISINVKDKEKKDKPQKVTRTVETKVKNNAQKEIDNTKHTKGPVEIKTKASKDAQNAINKIEGKRIEIHIKPVFEGTWEKTATIKVETQKVPGKAKGQNNYIQYHSAPTFGSAAKGYGTVGPKNKGGLTLTGEKGYEIAWLPSENRSMILGVGGPQMITLPDDAVVYTHEQSKDIIKRKGIPAGSHAEDAEVGRTKKINNKKDDDDKKKDNKKSTGKVSKKSDKKDKKTTDKAEKVVDKAGKVSVWWENQTRKVDAIQRKVDKTLKAFEKAVGTVGTTYKTAKKSINDYTKKLNKSISLNNDSIKKANTNLKNADKSTKKSTSISWDTKKGKKTVKKSSKISLSNFISYDSDLDTYIINQKAIDSVAKKSKNKAQAIKDAAQKLIEDNLSKRNTGIDNVEKAREALEKLADDVYKTFFSWENSLNKIYLLSQKLQDLNSRLEVRQANEELIEARATAGFGRENDFERLQNILKEEEAIMERQLEGNKTNLTASAEAYEKSLQLSTYVKRYAKTPNSLEAKNDFNAAKLALQFLKDTGLNTSDTFNYEKAVAELEKKELPEDTINRMKDVLEKINENRSNLVNAQNETLASATAIYQKLSEYQDFIVEFENDLLSGLEEQTEKEINRLDKLNSSLSETFKDLLDEVKQSLDERRQQEDNAKTQQDISQKQQRLAMLRADTSGSHQTEIAQLEKEIAEAQQDYGRSLEDQLINKLQQQGDNAEKQRQRQIELLQAQQEIAKVTGKNLKDVKEWLVHPEDNQELIKNAWLSGKGYDEATSEEQEKLRNEWDATWAKYQAYSNEATQLKTAIKSNESLSDIEKFVSNIDNTLSQKIGNDIKSFKASSGTAKEARLAGFKAENLKGTYTNKEIVGAGYKKADLAKAGITVKNLKSNKISAEVAKAAGFTAKELGKNKYTLKELVKAGYSLKELTSAGYTTGGIAKAAKELKMKPEAIAKKYGAAVALKAGVSGAAVQKTLGTSTSAIQKIINENKKDAATQGDLAGTKTNLDINGKKKGGTVSGTVNIGGRTVTANKGSTLYSQKINTKTGKTTGKATKKTIDKLTVEDFNKNKKEATEALISAIKSKKVGSKINKEMKSLVTKAGIVGKYYKLQNGVQGSIGSNGKIYYNTKDGVKIWNAATGNIGSDKYDKNSYLKKALKNDAISREYAQVLINKKAFTKPQLQNKGVKKFASGGLADFTGPAWLDGTPTKPEVVLSAADTKNFIMLRDVLSKAMSSSGSTENSYANTEFNININIEKVADDYDVDKIITKVKKEITKSAGYRNVTQVRSFR